MDSPFTNTPMEGSPGYLPGDAMDDILRIVAASKNSVDGQKELLISLELQSLVFQSMDDGVSVSDENGYILLTNPAEDKMFGYETGELTGLNVTVQNAYPPEENEAIVAQVISELTTKGFWSGEWHNRKKDGTEFYTNSYITSVTAGGNTYFVCVQRDISHEKEYTSALTESEERYATTVYSSDLGLWDFDALSGKVIASGRMAEIYGLESNADYTPEQVLACIHPEDKAEQVAFYDTVAAGKTDTSYTTEYRILLPNTAGVRWVKVIGKAFFSPEKKLYRTVGTVADITEQREAEAKLSNRTALLEAHLRASDDGILLVGADGKIISYNQRFIDIWNMPAEIVQSKDDEAALTYAMSQLVKPEQFIDRVKYLYANPTEKSIDELEYKDGKIIERNGYAVVGEDGTYFAWSWTFKDVTAQRNFEQALKDSEENFRSLANSIPQLAWMTDAEGWIYWYNQRWYDYTGTDLESMQGWGWQTVHHPDLIEGVISRFTAAVKKGTSWEDTFLIRGADGIYRWFLSRANPIKDNNGQIVKWFGTNTDISAQREIEQALKNSKEQLELTFRNVPSAIYHFDKNGKILYLNDLGARQMGYDNIQDVLAEKDVFNFRKRLDQLFVVLDVNGKPLPADKSSAALAFATGRSSEVLAEFIHRETGRSFWLLSRSTPLLDDEGNLMLVLTTATDITLQKTSESAIRQSEEKFRTLTETLPQLVWMTNEKGENEYTSRRWKEYTGLEPKDENTWSKMVHPDDLQQIGDAWAHSMQTGETYHSEVRLLNRDGHYRWHFVQGEPIRNEEGKILKWIGSFTDIDDQKTLSQKLEQLVAERTKELERSNEDLQQFAHVASHDLKEPVRKVKTFTNRLNTEFGDVLPEKAKNYLDKIEKASDRMYAMIEGVLLFSYLGAGEENTESVDLNKVFRDIQTDLEIVIQQKQAVFVFPGSLPTITGSGVLLHQLFYNLVNNSLKFSRNDPCPVLEIISDEPGPEEIKNYGLQNIPYVKIRVKDNGIGFDQAFADRIFTTFARLNSKDKYEGTGLGLSLCKKIAERHGGIITAMGKEEEGAVFTVILPVKAIRN